MCERCEDRERQAKIACACSGENKDSKETIVENVNRTITSKEEQEIESKRIDTEMERLYNERIDGFEKQLRDSIRDLANFSTKMLIMLEDYMKRGDTKEMKKLLQSIGSYSTMSQVTSSVVTTTINMLIEKLQARGRNI